MPAEPLILNSQQFLEQIARMTLESETQGGYTWEDASATLNDLITSARELTGVDPGYPRLYCMECHVPRDECSCDEPEEENEG